MRKQAPAAGQWNGVPSCAGLMTRLACARARSAGIDLAPVLQRAGLTMRAVEDESIRLSVAAQINCVNLLAEALNDRILGFHVAEEMDLRRAGFLYYVAASAETLGDGLQGIARYSAMFNEGIKVTTDLGDAVRIGCAFSGVSRQSDRHEIEAWTTAIVRFCREITGRDIVPLRVRIMHQRIKESAALDSFFGRTVEFGADGDEVWLAGDAAKIPIINADPYLNRLVTAYCEEVLARRKPRAGALQADVENAIATLLPHGPTHIEKVAQKLGLSPRTLRRKLAAEGVTFAGILDELRFALARHYLAEQDLSISRIAWLLGYTEVSAFSHAFRRWSGHPPRADRARPRRKAPRDPAPTSLRRQAGRI